MSIAIVELNGRHFLVHRGYRDPLDCSSGVVYEVTQYFNATRKRAAHSRRVPSGPLRAKLIRLANPAT